MISRAPTILAAAALTLATPAIAQAGHPAGHVMQPMPGMSPSAPAPEPAVPAAHPGHDMAAMAAMSDMAHDMPAMLGPYAMNREASGTSWQPDSAPMGGGMFEAGGWMGMVQGYATSVRDHQGGPRGDDKTFVESMAMVMASRSAGANGRIGLRAMLSLDPAMGRDGYPLLFATGETADGRTELVDRQHPHDLFMELAASYSHDLGGGRAVFLYAGLPGEPALGPPTFMHRVSGMDNPEAPIGHHWFDSTHITWGVVTAGYSTGTWKLEASAFKGREPDQHRWDVEAPKLDSWAMRAFWNPTADLSLQASTGRLHSPEQLHPDEDEQRTTVSGTWNLRLRNGGNWAATIAWSLKDARPGPALQGWLAETAFRWHRRHTVFARAEREQERELFGEDSPLHDDVVPVSKLSLGYQYAAPLTGEFGMALGVLVSAYAYPQRLTPSYGRAGVKSFLLYARFSYGYVAM